MRDDGPALTKMFVLTFLAAAAARDAFFDGVPVFFLSLNRTATGRARTAKLHASFDAAGRHVELVPAVDGNASARDFTHVDQHFHHLLRRNTASEMGCTLSHVLAIRRAEEHCRTAGCEMAVIMEDDVGAELLPHWTVSITELAASLPDNWAVVQLQLIAQQREWEGLMSAWRARPSLTVSHDRRSHFGTGAYLMHVRGMRQVRWRPACAAPVPDRPAWSAAHGAAPVATSSARQSPPA